LKVERMEHLSVEEMVGMMVWVEADKSVVKKVQLMEYSLVVHLVPMRVVHSVEN
jgi:hypothetical protein